MSGTTLTMTTPLVTLPVLPGPRITRPAPGRQGLVVRAKSGRRPSRIGVGRRVTGWGRDGKEQPPLTNRSTLDADPGGLRGPSRWLIMGAGPGGGVAPSGRPLRSDQ